MLNVALKQKETVEIKSATEFTFAVLEIATTSFSENVVVAGTSYQILEV